MIKEQQIIYQTSDHLFKLVIIGNSGVGKSSLLLRFADDAFNETYLTTLGVDFWDTAGQERFRTITNAYYKGANAIIIVYDVTSQSSFDDIDKFWINEINSNAEKNVKLMIIGNKSDSTHEVDSETVKTYAESKGMQFFEASAKSGDCVQTAFHSLISELIKDQANYQSKPLFQNKAVLNGKTTLRAKGGCC